MKISRSRTTWAGFLFMLAAMFALYRDPFVILWWPPEPAQSPDHAPLNMETQSIDDMYEGCRSKMDEVIDLIGVFERRNNKPFGSAWAFAETRARTPVHKDMKRQHAIALYVYTSAPAVRREFNAAVKEGKRNYGTHEFQFHYFYFYLTEVIQLLRRNLTSCGTSYHRTSERYDLNVANTKMRFGAYVWAASNKQTFESIGQVSCFEIHSCLGADVTFYSANSQPGQVLIPPYEVFTVTEVLKDEQWCNVVYKIQSSQTFRADLNCELNIQQIKTFL
ncbi:GPI-linked NAD(P)(+)--arginine ADP-ribosyltransferase 1-like isoform X2 [Nerophis ophidion]|uniref:GPI-linked NAD(P)(+)--arginine ADP-ribosyltransferase 1-like isoform X2 n=1 Tax=Nerophis ophidion TaxID=159077 RepID=UPI002ADF70FE|nr:GPI-linked NAD(P)(+)--arginine ADP-ribosyltransferase 1-like isoform X2 [Nerophis ophidion]XP_061736380.1 GPI-linked NAD(P)(+)--arginine ADP-ribosyltransferase 1-like isoform X2 [Nerophis ophidion]XP_061736381.1 GPI-linked NAD(P)(+)--arginine ADP-ribosyltransferase 1-like isoform X2 [Nerophis ophidion]